MDQARYWMWTKRKQSSYDDSWEEQAFAEDAAGSLGGCIWPPRSYACSFCRREFRSAQALGGHMNVHRRDRARLKQSSSPQEEHFHQQHENHPSQHNNPFVPMGFSYPPHEYYSFPLANPNPNLDPANAQDSPSLASRFSPPPVRDNPSKEILFSPFIKRKPLFKDGKFSSFIVSEDCRRSHVSSSPLIWSNMVAERNNLISSSISEEGNNSKSLEQRVRAKGDCIKTDLSVSLNLARCRSRSAASDDDKEDDFDINKRRRTDESKLPFEINATSVNRHHVHSEVFKFCPSSIEELDLELRLGDPPKVK